MQDKSQQFRVALHDLSKRVKENYELSEGDIYSNLLNIGFFGLLGYESYGKDVRTMRIIDGHVPDYYCVDEYERTIFVLEVKKPTDELPLIKYRNDQLRDKYVRPLRASFGILTNGIEFILYKRVGNDLQEIRILKML